MKCHFARNGGFWEDVCALIGGLVCKNGYARSELKTSINLTKFIPDIPTTMVNQDTCRNRPLLVYKADCLGSVLDAPREIGHHTLSAHIPE